MKNVFRCYERLYSVNYQVLTGPFYSHQHQFFLKAQISSSWFWITQVMPEISTSIFKSSNSSPADVSLPPLYECLLIYWFWFVLGWNTRTADGERARQLESPHVSEQQNRSEPGSLHLELLDVVRPRFDADGEILWRNGSKMKHFTFVIKWLLLQMSSCPARNTTTTTGVTQPSLIYLFQVINKTSLCVRWGVFARFTGQLKMCTRECLVHHFTHTLGIS